MTSTERSLVLGAHTGLPARLVEPFARSLRASGFQGRLVVFVGLCGDEEKEALRELVDVLVDVDAEYPAPSRVATRFLSFLRSKRGFRRLYAAGFSLLARRSFGRWASLEFHLEGLQSLRYFHYRRFLAGLDIESDCVLLSDLRDVAFQGDPFAEPVSDLELYLEDDSVRIGHDSFNTRWIRNLYGSAQLGRWENAPVSCSGTVVGTGPGVLGYLEEMTEEIARHRRPLGSHDQGIHNALVLRGRVPSARVVANGSGRVLTLGKMPRYELASDGAVRNHDGTVPPILHQWDRHATLVAKIAGVTA